MSDTLFILLGATGDLAKRKLIPALYQLIAQRQISPVYVVGAALEEATVESIMRASRPYMHNVDERVYAEFVARFSYHRLYSGDAGLQDLVRAVKELSDKVGLANRVIYMAVPALFYCSLTQQLAQQGIICSDKGKKEPWCRVVFEKPFGQDQLSAHELNECLARILNERQIYRVDHYLGKDIIGNIALLRFTNRIFEPLWNGEHIAWVEILLSETIGVGNRGGYYDLYGALKDVVQNHMLQILALIAMEMPNKLEGNDIRDQKAAVLKRMRCVDGILGQYAGYREAQGVKENSATETFAVLKILIDTQRWKDVPFYIKTGKTLHKRETKIVVQFKGVDCLLSRQCPSEPNALIIQIQPEGGFGLMVNVKKPGLALEVEPVLMNFCYEHHFAGRTLTGYEAVLEEVLSGEQSISVRFDEIEYAWALIDAVKKANFPLYTYEQGSNGPKELEDFAARNKMRWHI